MEKNGAEYSATYFTSKRHEPGRVKRKGRD